MLTFSKSGVIFFMVYILLGICKGESIGEILPSSPTPPLEEQQVEGQTRDLINKKWPFFSSDPVTVPNRKPLKPKPFPGAHPVWSWDDKSGSSFGWVNLQSACASTVQATSYELTKTTITATEISTITEYYTTTETEVEYETETVAEGPTVTTITVTPTPSSGWGWTSPSSTVYTVTETDHTVQTETSTLEITSTVMQYETSTFSTTTTTTATSFSYNILTATTFVTSSTTETATTTLTETASSQYVVCRGGNCTTGLGWGPEDQATIVLEPSVSFDQSTSTITTTVSETPTLTVHVPSSTTVTTSLEISTETVLAPFSTTPPITITEIVATSLNMIVDTVTSTLLTSSPICTLTTYEYLTTVTTPSTTITASYCGSPCGSPEKCEKICYPKIATTTIDITSTSVVTAAMPILVTYSAIETKTAYTIEDSILVTTKTVDVTATPSMITLTSTEILPAEVSTETTQVTLSEYPTTITTSENLCTTTVFETCTKTTTLPPSYVTIVDTQVVGVIGTVVSQTTSFTAPPIPTETSYIQGGVNSITATSTSTIVTDSKPATTTITQNVTTVGYGEVTITPTTTVFNIHTATITSTPVLNATQIKRRTLLVEEYTTSVEETTESYVITPEPVTDYLIVEITPPPAMVTVSSLVIGWTSVDSGWKQPQPSKIVG